MNKKTTFNPIDWYEKLPDDVRMKLQNDFRNFDIPDRETKFFKWIKSFTKTKIEKYEKI